MLSRTFLNPKMPNPKMQDFARRLLAYESTGEPSSGADISAVAHVAEKLRRPVCTLAGATGFRSLLTRALTLARREAPGLGTVSVKPDGSLDGLDGLAYGEVSDAGIALIAQLLGLLATFIGESLTLSLMHDAWPELPTDDTNPGK